MTKEIINRMRKKNRINKKIKNPSNLMLSILGLGRFYDGRISSIKMIDTLSMGKDMDRTRRKRETARKKDPGKER